MSAFYTVVPIKAARLLPPVPWCPDHSWHCPCRCISELQEAINANSHLQSLVAGVEVQHLSAGNKTSTVSELAHKLH